MTSPKPVGPPHRAGRGTGPDGDRRAGWTVVLPVKGGDGAKSRLRADPGLATAIAQDCLDAGGPPPTRRRRQRPAGRGHGWSPSPCPGPG
jgi:hypothetical protein